MTELTPILGKRIVSESYERGPANQIWHAHLGFADGTALSISIEAQYCNDAWLKFEYTEEKDE